MFLGPGSRGRPLGNATNIRTGNLSVKRQNSGTNANSQSLWRGDGTWSTQPYTIPTNISGSATTTTGTISAASANLVLAAASDFQNGQGIRVNHAGAAFTLNAPTAASATPVGTPGATTYTYTIAAIATGGGVGTAIATFSTATGNAALSTTNYVQLSWTASTGTAPAAYAVYGRVGGSLTLLGYTNGVSFPDTGSAYPTVVPDWLPSTPPGSALAANLVTSIRSGGGSTSLILATAATTAASGLSVFHDDTAALQAAITTASASNYTVLIPNGIYRVTSTLSISNRILICGVGPAGDLGLQYQGLLPTSYAGLNGTVIACDILCGFISATTNAPVVVEDLEILYLSKPIQGLGYAIQIAGTGAASTSNTQSCVRRCLISGADGSVLLTNVLAAQIDANWFINGWSFGVVMTSPNYISYNQNEVSGNLFTGNGSADFRQNTYTSHLEVRAGGDFRVINNKFNNGSPTNTSCILLSGTSSAAQFMEPVIIVGNTMEGGCANGIKISPSSTSFNTNQVVVTGNQFWGATYGILVPGLGSGTNMINDLVVTGNAFMINNTGQSCIALNNTDGAVIVGNTFNPAFGTSANPAIVLSSNTTRVNVQSNLYSPNFTFGTPPIANSSTSNTIGGGSA